MKLEIKRSTFINILIIFVLLNIILGISIYLEVKQVSIEEQMRYFLTFLAIITVFFLGYLLGNYKGYIESQNNITRINKLTREMRKVREKRKGGKYGHPLSKYECYDCGSLLRIGGSISEGFADKGEADDIFFCENCDAVYYGKKELTLPKNKRSP